MNTHDCPYKQALVKIAFTAPLCSQAARTAAKALLTPCGTEPPHNAKHKTAKRAVQALSAWLSDR